MIKKNWVRHTLGIILGGCAGLSLIGTILPTILSTIGMGPSFIIRYELVDYAAHVALLWAVGGWGVVKIGNPRAGSIILGLIGVLTGALVCLAVYGPVVKVLVVMAVGGAAYGTIGGLLLGRVLEKSE